MQIELSTIEELRYNCQIIMNKLILMVKKS